MATYVSVVGGVVVQKQPYSGKGFVEAPDWVVCGMVVSGDSYVAPTKPVSDIRAEKIALTKAEAQRRIYAKYPQWKQANMQARSAELFAIESGQFRNPDGTKPAKRALTAGEEAELAAMSGAWAKAKAIRSASDEIEASVMASENPGAFDVLGDARWPV